MSSFFLCRLESRGAESSPEKEFPTGDVRPCNPAISCSRCWRNYRVTPRPEWR